jgi:glycosyltransferase involved in cell wall biosynthesis
MKVAVIGARGLPQQIQVSPVSGVAETVFTSKTQPQQRTANMTRAEAATSGIEHYCAEIYPLMAAQGYAVDLYGRSSYTHQAWYAQESTQGVRTISMPALQMRGADALISSGLAAINSLVSQYDIIHFHALGPALFTILPRLASSAKVVVTCHGLDWQRAKWGKLSSRLILLGEQVAVRYAHEITVVSQALQDYFWKTYGRETVYIPNAPATYASSDPSFQFGQSLGLSQQKYVIFLGRLVPEKAPDLLVRAFQQLRPDGWKLVFIGKSSDTSTFTTDLLQLAIDDPQICFTGELAGERLAEIVRGAGLFVLPSNLEGMPLSLLEAMQEGVPVLASDIPPHQQLIGGDRGLLFERGNLASLVQQLDWAIAHPEAMAEYRQRAQAYIQTYYRWDQITAQTLQLYQTLLQQ